MKHRSTYTVLAGLLLLLALAACNPGAPQTPNEAPASTAQPLLAEPTNDYPVAPSDYPASEASPTTAAPTTAPTAEPLELPSPTVEPPAPWVSYIGADQNLWIINPTRGEIQQITQDAQPFQPGLVNLVYCCGKWSSDGKYLAYSRHVGTPVAEGGYNYTFHLWVFDITTGQAREVLADQQSTGFDWQPGTHTLTYGLTIANDYFTNHGVNPSLASGLWTVDVDSGAVTELVKPERGFSLVNPHWSPDGRFVSFEEVYLMEGIGKFAYYDLAAGEYNPWDESIGRYRWSPDGETLYYDYLTYTPSGSERIFRNNRQNTDEQQISPDIANTIAYSPILTPDGSQVVYITEEMVSEGIARYQVVMQPSISGDVRLLGEFEQPGELSISADGSLLLLATGQWDNRQIEMISLQDGSVRPLVQGQQPVWQPVGGTQPAP